MPAARNPGGTARTLGTVALLTLDTLFWSRKTVFMMVISTLVVGLAVLGRAILSFHWVRAPFTPGQVFGTLMSTAVIHFLVVFITLFYGTALISDELDGKTLTYLFTRPVPKPALMAGKLLALAWICLILVIPTTLASYVVLYAGSGDGFLSDIGLLGRDLGVLSLALLAYGALFALLGAWLRHPVLPGLIYAFGWEGIVSYLPGFTRKLTITHYVQSIFPHDDSAAAIAMMIGRRTEATEAVVTLMLLTALLAGAACLVVREKEYVLDQ